MTTLGLALGGGGARGLAHIHVLEALDELGVVPDRIVGSSIGAIMGAGRAAGMGGSDIRDFVLDCFAGKSLVFGRLWRTRPGSFQEFLADGGLRFGQLNAERVVRAFLPLDLPLQFEDLHIPLGVMTTDFYGKLECEIDSGDLFSALAATAALPAVFRPVRRSGRVLIDGGIFNPLPFDRLQGKVDKVIAVDVNGGPRGGPDTMPTPLEALFGASQLMMQSIIDSKVHTHPPDLLICPPVSHYGVLDFLRTKQILEETSPVKEETKRALDGLLSGRKAHARKNRVAAAEAG
ncbi:patatin-like phospholipase family protein [Aurantimonas sp. A2-1-M11]|uniref:patatin-like phospholipase family protein n=1 Tax=Aurantimonas sp. A2-1-M11 TaxID=3113712 RepID=UPI002F93596E